jgi:hypothetical protein
MKSLITGREVYKQKEEGKYYTIDMAGRKRYFKTLEAAKEWSRFINEKTAMYPHIYRVQSEKKFKGVM